MYALQLHTVYYLYFIAYTAERYHIGNKFNTTPTTYVDQYRSLYRQCIFFLHDDARPNHSIELILLQINHDKLTLIQHT